MSYAYWDTSCILKLLQNEKGASFLQGQLDPTNPVLFSNFGLLEFESVIYRQHRKSLITLPAIQKLESQLMLYLDLRQIVVIRLNDELVSGAIDLVKSYGPTRECQTYDALHLATAIELHKRGSLALFVTADRTLLKLAQDHGLPTLDPETA